MILCSCCGRSNLLLYTTLFTSVWLCALGAPECDIDANIQLCMKPVQKYQLTLQQHSHQEQDKQLHNMCSSMKEMFECMEQFSERCLTDAHITKMNQHLDYFRKYFRNICESKAQQEEYVSHLDCSNSVRHEHEKCLTRYKKKLRHIVSIFVPHNHTQTREQRICCAAHRYLSCTIDHVKSKCRPEDIDFTVSMLTNLQTPILHDKCGDHNSSQCEVPGKQSSPSVSHTQLYASSSHTPTPYSLFILFIFYIVSY